jgi:hypothetical protein
MGRWPVVHTSCPGFFPLSACVYSPNIERPELRVAGERSRHVITSSRDVPAGAPARFWSTCWLRSRERERLSGDSRHLRGAKEDKTGWGAFLKHLKERGLKGTG